MRTSQDLPALWTRSPTSVAKGYPTTGQVLPLLSEHPHARLVSGNTSVGVYKPGEREDDDDFAERPDGHVIDLQGLPQLRERSLGDDGQLGTPTATVRGPQGGGSTPCLTGSRNVMAVLGSGVTLSELIALLTKIKTAEPGVAPVVVDGLLDHLSKIAGTLVRNTASIGGNLVMTQTKVGTPMSDLLLPEESGWLRSGFSTGLRLRPGRASGGARDDRAGP
jgi:hypothetical protein